MGTVFAIAFLGSTVVMVALALILGLQQWLEDRRTPPSEPAE